MKVTWHPPQQPDIRPLGPRLYRLETDYSVELDRHIEIHINEGFRTDGASVPRLAWWFMRPDGPWRAAALIHDYICFYAGHITVQVPGGWKNYQLSFQEAADIFLQLMEAFDVAPWRREVAYWAVRCCGPRW